MRRPKRCMGLLFPYPKEILRLILHLPNVVSIAFCFVSFQMTFAQDQVNNAVVLENIISRKEYNRIIQTSVDANKKIITKTSKYIDELLNAEVKLQNNIKRKSLNNNIDQLNSREFYASLKEQLIDPAKSAQSNVHVYIPNLDSLITSLKFLQINNVAFSNIPGINQQSLAELLKVQGSLDRLNSIDKALTERRKLLESQVMSLGLLKDFKKFGNKFADFQAQVKSIHENLNQPDKLIASSLNVLQTVPEFRKFFQKNSALASFFRLPDPGQPVDMASIQGLQTREQMQTLLLEKFGLNNVAPPQGNLSQLPGMESYLQSVKSKIPKGTGNALQMPVYKSDPAKAKTFGKRLEYGINIQSVRANSIFPSTSDIGLSIGLRFSELFQAGIGASYKIGWGESIQKMTITHQGVGLRTYLESKIKNTFFLSGGFEMNYRSEIRNYDQLKDYSAWQKSALLGITKKFKISNKLKGNMQALFDLLYNSHIPKTQPLLFRIGYGF